MSKKFGLSPIGDTAAVSPASSKVEPKRTITYGSYTLKGFEPRVCLYPELALSKS